MLIKSFLAEHKVKVFRVVLFAFGAAHGLGRDERDGSGQGGGRTRCVRLSLAKNIRWKIELFHRETKQLTGIEGNQFRKARIVRSPIGCAVLVWVRLKQVAVETQ